jgi:Zn-dependent protease/CBS domain-containing protein
MRRTVRVGNLLGVPVQVDYSWFMTFLVFWFGLATLVFPDWYPELSPFYCWWLAAAATVIGFLCVLLHEWGHCLIAQRNNLEVGEITLFLFGGVATLKREPASAWTEFQLAGAGPLCNVILGIICVLLSAAMRQFPFGETAATFSLLLALGNFGLALFNLIPGLPLDGGRMLRALLWLVSRNFQRSTTWVTFIGQVYSSLLMAGGFWLCLHDVLRNLQWNFAALQSLGNLLLKATGVGWIPPEYRTVGLGIGMILMGWVLLPLACAAGQQQRWQHALTGVKVRQILPATALSIPADLTVDALVERYLLPRRESSFAVVEGEQLVGLVTWAKVRALPVESRAQTTAGQIAVPAPSLPTIEAESDAWETLNLMMERHLEQIAVTGNAQFLGIVTQDDLLHWANRKIALG